MKNRHMRAYNKDMERKYRQDKKTTSLLKYQFVFCSKNRRKIFSIDGVEERTVELIKEICQEQNIKIESLSCVEEHVILSVEAPPILSPVEIMQRIKIRTSGILRNEFKELEKMSSLWTRNFWVSTITINNNEQIQEFINNQKKRS